MSLKLDYVDKEQFTTFKDAYVRIISGNFNARFVNVTVGVYASKDAREAEKNREALTIAYEDSMEKLAKAQKELEQSESDLGKLYSDLENSNSQFSEGKIKQEDHNKKVESYNAGRKDTESIQKQYQQAISDQTKIIDQLKVLPNTKLLDFKYFTFDRKDNDKIDFGYLYDLLKNSEDFKGAVDA